jgi:ABC-type sugar transport system substrate-binding protein
MALEMEVIKEAVAKLPAVVGRVPRKLGYVVNFSFHVWYKVVERYMRARAAQYGISDVALLDANQSLETELKAMDRLIAEGVDALIITPVPAAALEQITERAAAAKIPLVIEANPVPGMATMVAICDYDAGFKTGRWAGEYLKNQGVNTPSVLDIAYPLLRPCLLRSEGFLDGLRSVLPATSLAERVNGEARVDVAAGLTRGALTKNPGINVVFAMDDESIHGGMEAVRAMNLRGEPPLMVGFGLAGDDDKERLLEGGEGLLKASLAMFPEWVGVRCVDQAVRLYNGLPVKTHDVVPTLPLTQQSLTTCFTRTHGGWVPDFAAIAKIPREDRCAKI